VKKWLIAFGIVVCGGAMAQTAPPVISTGKIVVLEKFLVAERPTLFLFYRAESSLEAQFAAQMQKDAGENVGVRLIRLQTGKEPIARQYDILKTPTAMVFDRRARLVARSSDAEEIKKALSKAAAVMRIDWAEEGTALFEEASQAAGGKALKPGIMRTMSLKPEYLKHFHTMTRKAHFEDGYLTRRTKEMIATFVSGINHCKF
jgi:hypothetical protein